ncbi:hypothetical protein P3T18_001159 [Paraburkholderia sp. GAS199]|uniref:hypothetical protein n=1 Tax=Paraburkholderia sp. GAS199 TaxID=3035126 RepID=UPI003D1BD31C
MNSGPSDQVERADDRRATLGNGDVKEESDGIIRQRPHGNMDETLVPRGKSYPEQQPYVPEHDVVGPDSSPDASIEHPHGKEDIGL